MNTTAFVGGMLLALVVGGSAWAAECPNKSFSVADAKGQEQLGACLRLANDLNVAALQKRFPMDKAVEPGIYVVRLTKEGRLDGFTTISAAAYERDKGEVLDGMTNYFIAPDNQHYTLAEGAYQQFIGRAPAKDEASNRLARLVRHLDQKNAGKMPVDVNAADAAFHAEDQKALLSSNNKR